MCALACMSDSNPKAYPDAAASYSHIFVDKLGYCDYLHVFECNFVIAQELKCIWNYYCKISFIKVSTVSQLLLHYDRACVCV